MTMQQHPLELNLASLSIQEALICSVPKEIETLLKDID